MPAFRHALACLGLALVATPAVAQETIDIGTIKNDDITVVQRLLYPKAGRTEVGVHVGVMPFDAYTTTPNAQLSFAQHVSERFALSVVAGAGYGLKTGVYKTLESPTYGVAPNAYAYLGAALVGFEWSPVYAKLNLNGSSVIHFDVYLTLRAGVTLEQSVINRNRFTPGPTLSPGGGSRLFLGRAAALKLELRDDLLVQNRTNTEDPARDVDSGWQFKQNANLTLGLVIFTGVRK